MSYSESAGTTGIRTRTAGRWVQQLVRDGTLVLHDRELDIEDLVPDSDSSSGLRIGLRMVHGIVPRGLTPAEVLETGRKRLIVRRQEARVKAARAAFTRERLIDESPNVVRLSERRESSVGAAKSRLLERCDPMKCLNIRRTPGRHEGRQYRVGDEKGLLDYAVASLMQTFRCKVCGRAEAWLDEIGNLIKCRICHPPAERRHT